LERVQSLGDTGATDLEGEGPGERPAAEPGKGPGEWTAAGLQLELDTHVSGMAHVVQQAKLLLFPQVLERLLEWIVENQAADGAELMEHLDELAAHTALKPLARARLERALAAEFGAAAPCKVL